MANEDEENSSRDEGGVPFDDVPLGLDAMLDVVSNERRRYLLEHLESAPDETRSLDEATRYVISEEARRADEQPSHDAVRTALQHLHLPKLASAGIVEYDVRSKTIRYRGDDRLERLLDLVREFEAD